MKRSLLPMALLLAATRAWADAGAPELPVVKTLESPHRVFTLALSADGTLLATAGPHGTVSFWDAASGKLLRHGKGSSDDSTSIAISPDKTRIATGGIEGNVRLFDVASGSVILSYGEHGARLMRVAFSPDGSLAASTSWDTHLRWWKNGAPAELGLRDSSPMGLGGFTFDNAGKSIYCSALPEGLALRTGVSFTVPIHQVDLAGKEVRDVVMPKGPVWTIAESPDGKLLALGRSDGAIEVWDLAQRKRLGEWPAADPAGDKIGTGIVALTFVNQGKTLFAAAMNGTGGTFEVPSGRKLLALNRSTLGFVAASVATGTNQVAVSAWNKKIEIFDLLGK